MDGRATYEIHLVYVAMKTVIKGVTSNCMFLKFSCKRILSKSLLEAPKDY